jgi:hypothetical protein
MTGNPLPFNLLGALNRRGTKACAHPLYPLPLPTNELSRTQFSNQPTSHRAGEYRQIFEPDEES